MKWLLITVTAAFSALASAQTAQPIIQPEQHFVDGSGNPCAGCSLYSYAAGTTTPQATYTSSSGATPNTNPVILDATGSAQIWMGTSAYKFVLLDTGGTTLWTVDNVLAPAPGSAGGPFLPLTGGTLTGALTAPYYQFTSNSNTCTPGQFVSGWGPGGWSCGVPTSTGTAPFVPGLIAFGDSICAYIGATMQNQDFVSLLALQMGGGLQNYCVSGYQIVSEPSEMYNNGPSYPTQGNNPLNIEEGGKNDASICQSNDNCDANAQFALNTMLSHRGSNNITPVANCTASGSWAADSDFPSFLASTTTANSMTCSITTYGASAIGVTYKAKTSNGGTASVTIDSVLQSPTLTAAGVGGYAIGGGAFFTAFTTFYPVSAGTHTVLITVTSGTGAGNVIAIGDIVSAANPLTYYATPFVGSMEVIPYQNNSIYNDAWVNSINTVKQGVVSTLKGYGFNVAWLPITNVPCQNGVASCAGGFNAPNYISNQPSVHNPDGLSCAGSTSDTVHPNNCGHQQIFQAIQKDLGITQGFNGSSTSPQWAQNIYSASHTLTPSSDGILYMGPATTLTLPAVGGTVGPFLVWANGGTVTIAVAGGATNENVPTTLGNGQAILIQSFDANWFMSGYMGANYAIPTVYSANHTMVPGVDGNSYIAGTGLTWTFPATGTASFATITNNGSANVTLAFAGGATNENGIPTTLVPGQTVQVADYLSNWWLLGNSTPVGNSFRQSLVITTGICTTGGTAGATCTSPTSGSYSWPTAFADTSYGFTCMAVTPTGSGAPSLNVYQASKAAGTFTLTLQNGQGSSGNANTTSEIDCLGIHN